MDVRESLVGRPVAAFAAAARRPQTYTAQAREAASLAITAAMWPFGWVDRGITHLRSEVGAATSPNETPVLLIHGYGANKSNWFFVDRELRNVGFERLHALNYSPLRATLPDLADRATHRARELMHHFGTDRIHIVGHSLGGIIARSAIQLSGLEGVDTCVTVASPHGGAPLARFARRGIAADLRPGSPALRRLHASARRLPTRFVAFYSNVDMLSPGDRSRIVEPALRATNVLVKDEGHTSMLLSRRVAMAIAAELARAEQRSTLRIVA